MLELETNVMIMEFKEDASVEALKSPKAYQELIPHHDRAFKEISISFTTYFQ